MSPIVRAMAQGHSVNQILSFVTRLYPALTPKINQAKSAGYTVDQILDFVSKTMEGGKPDKRLSQSEIHALNSKKQSELTKDLLKGAVSFGGNIASAALLAKGIPSLLRAAGIAGGGPQPQPQPPGMPVQAPQQPQLPPPQAPQAITNVPSPMPPIGPGGGVAVPQPVNVSKGPGLPPAKALPAPQMQPEPVTQGPVKPESGAILENLGIRLKIEKMRHQGHEPNTIIQAAEKMVPKELRGQFPVKEVVSDYLSKPPETALGKLPEGKGINYKGLLEPFEDKPVRPEDYQRQPEEVKPLDKGALVLTPQGKISEVKARGPTGLIVDDGGKGVKHKEEELEQEPEDVIEIVNNILKIPEVDRSSVVSLFTYDPEDKQMIIQFHNGESFKYYGMEPEEVKEIAEKNGTPVTEGKNVFGAWSPEDKKSLGAALIQRVISNPKYKKPKKGEPANPNYKKLDTLYDFYEKLRKKPKRKS